MAAAKEAACRDLVAKDPWNTGAWDGLLNAVAAGGNTEKQRQVFDDLLSQFPNAVRSLDCIFGSVNWSCEYGTLLCRGRDYTDIRAQDKVTVEIGHIPLELSG